MYKKTNFTLSKIKTGSFGPETIKKKINYFL